jgi:hypothetical protein
MFYNIPKSKGMFNMIELKISAVVKKDGKWFIGYLDGLNFKTTRQIKKLKDVKKVTDYKTFKRFLKDQDKSPDLEPLILQKTGLQKIYVLDKPIEPGIKEFENWWWSSINKKCLDCIGTCKQSSKVELVKCPDYEKIEVNS